MISDTKNTQSNRKKINELLKDTSSLDQETIEAILIQAIRLYKKQEMSLHALAKIAKEMYQNKKCILSYSLKKDLAEISSFSVIDIVLTDILEDLKENETRKKNSGVLKHL